MNINHAELMRELPIPFLAYEARAPYRIIDENAAHEKVALTKREDIIGRPFLEVFPDTSDEFERTGKSAPIESIKKIVRTKEPDSLGEFKWDVPGADGGLVTKYWRSTQHPIFDESNEKVVAVYQLTEDVTHEQQTEQTLDQTQKKLIEVLSTGQVGTWSLDLANGIAKGGPNLARMFGIDAAVVAEGMPLDDFVERIHHDDRERVGAEIERAVKSGDLYESEYRVLLADGSVRWVLARGQKKLEDLDGTNVFSGTLVDITERKENERILLESESRLRFMADSMPQLVWVTRPDGYHEYYNRQWYEYTGTKPGSTDGEGWNDLFYPGDQARARKIWRRSLETGEPYEIEYRLYHAASDTYRWVIGRALPLRAQDGTILKWYGTCTDIDEQRRSTERQRFLSDVSKILVSTLDRDKMLTKITKLSVPVIADWCMVDLYAPETGFSQVALAHTDPARAKEVVEYRKTVNLHIDDDTSVPRVVRSGQPELITAITDELIERHIPDEQTRAYLKRLKLCSAMVVPLKDNRKTIGAISFMSAASGRHFDETDFEMAVELGARMSLSVTNSRLYTDSQDDLKRRKELESQLRTEKQTLEARVKERTTQLQLTNQGLRDEIERRQSVERELNEYGAELTRSNKELEDFAYVASHDLQEPLRKIQAFGNLLLGEYGDSLGIDGADYLKRMHSAANRMSTLIEDLLTFSRVARTEPRRQPVDLGLTLQYVTSDLETRIADTKAKVTVGKLPVVTADPTHMRQLFQNLIGNAVKFHRPEVPPQVTVRSKAKRGGFEITIADNGIGFDEKYLDRIFSVFQRLHERSNYEGTGIGLAVCRKIVERYGGTITAESTKGTGSTFIVWLPGKTK